MLTTTSLTQFVEMFILCFAQICQWTEEFGSIFASDRVKALKTHPGSLVVDLNTIEGDG